MAATTEDSLKLNVYVTIFSDHKKAGIGAILRNNEGENIMAITLLENEVLNLETVGTLAILKGLQLFSHQGIPKIIVKC